MTDRGSGWADVADFPTAPPDDVHVEQVFAHAGQSYGEIGESGWDAMLAWCCGPERLVKYPETRRFDDVVVLEETTDGIIERVMPRSPADQALLDEAANSFLRDIGVPERPSGFRWFLRLPDGLTVADLQRAAAEVMEHRNSMDRTTAELIKVAVRGVLRSCG